MSLFSASIDGSVVDGLSFADVCALKAEHPELKPARLAHLTPEGMKAAAEEARQWTAMWGCVAAMATQAKPEMVEQVQP